MISKNEVSVSMQRGLKAREGNSNRKLRIDVSMQRGLKVYAVGHLNNFISFVSMQRGLKAHTTPSRRALRMLCLNAKRIESFCSLNCAKPLGCLSQCKED